MHEAALARQLVAAVLARASREGHVARVVAIGAWIAESEHLDTESLRLHFAAQAAGTIAAGANLDVRVTAVAARCPACGETFVPDHGVPLCPGCGGADAALLGPTGLGIDTMEVEVEGEP